jgi:hypothetical protein
VAAGALALPLPVNFYDPGRPTLAGTRLPTVPGGDGGEEGERIWKMQLSIERDRATAKKPSV